MKKSALLFLCALVLAACGGQSKQELQQQNDSLRTALSERDALLDEMIGSINVVQEGFSAINEAEGRISLESADKGGGENSSVTESIRQEMRFIAETMQKNKEEIEKLNQQIKAGNYNSAQLKKTIQKLTAQLTEKTQQLETLRTELTSKNIRIAELDSTVTNLTKDVNALTEEKMAQEKEIADQEKELNKAWYVYGTKKELKEQKILDGGEVLQNSNFNKNYFTEIDIRNEKVFDLHSKSAKLLTTHPENSYKLEKDSKKQYVLTITDPETFWSVSRYLVIQTR